MEFNYLLDGVGFIGRDTVKFMIQESEFNFTGFIRPYPGEPVAYCFMYVFDESRKLDVRQFKKPMPKAG